MAYPPTTYTWANKEIPTFNQLNDRLYTPAYYLFNPPMVRLRKTVAQNISSSTSTALSWDYVEVENFNFWDATAPTKLKPSVPGWYIGNVGYSFVGNATGYRELNVYKNGVTTTDMIRQKNMSYASAAPVVSRGNLFLEQFNGTTDYVEAHVWQNSGSTLAVMVDALERQPDFSLMWLAAL